MRDIIDWLCEPMDEVTANTGLVLAVGLGPLLGVIIGAVLGIMHRFN